MITRLIVLRALALGLLGILLPSGNAAAAEIKVMVSGGFAAAYRVLAPEFERTTGNKILTAFGPSMGSTPEAIPVRIQRGEPVDALIMVSDALDNLIETGKAGADSRIDLARSRIGMVVRAGAFRPDISSVDAFRRVLLDAKSIAYSDSASGVYISTELFQRLGIADQVKGKSKMIPGEPVGAIVARGEAEIGFQQISELRSISGIQFLGPLPSELQKITVFSAGVAAVAQEPEAAKALIRFLASPAAAPIVTRTGLEPMPPPQQDGGSHALPRSYRQ
jgi:molybdate transport system substrate-binding protein